MFDYISKRQLTQSWLEIQYKEHWLNSEDWDEMPQFVVSHYGLHWKYGGCSKISKH